MLKRWQFWILTLLAVAYAVTVGANIYFHNRTRALQVEVNQRAQAIQQAAPMEQLARDVVLALAQLGARNQDTQISSMLAGLGITVNVNQNPLGGGAALPGAASPAANPDGKRK